MMLRIGIIGAGRLGMTHANCLAQMEDVRVTAVADIAQAPAQRVAALSGAAVYEDYREMLDREPLDAVYVCSSTLQHAEQAIAVAERKIHLFLEKPLAGAMADGWRIRRAVETAGILSCVDYQWRYMPAVIKAEEILAGRPLALTAGQWMWTIPPVPWFRNKELGLGQVVDQSTHLLDLCQHFGGPVKEVYAAYTLNTYSDAEFHNWDGYSLTFKHAGGAVGSLNCTYALFADIAKSVPPSVTLVAREMHLRLAPDGLTVQTPEGLESYENGAMTPHYCANAAFITALRTGDAAAIRTPVAQTLRSLALTLAANESAVTGQPVDLDLFLERGR
jgi:predicted dehydrogenase